jgi:hypothetical protein
MIDGSQFATSLQAGDVLAAVTANASHETGGFADDQNLQKSVRFNSPFTVDSGSMKSRTASLAYLIEG